MNITGIEVLRPRNLATRVVAGEKIDLTYGEKLRVSVSFDYRGPPAKATLYGSIGNRGLTFDEKVKGQASIDLPSSPTSFTPCPRAVDIPITSDIRPGADYDLYCKIIEAAEAGLPEVDNVINIVGVPPTYTLIQHTIYHWAYTYEGKAETCRFEFKLTPEQIPGTAWLGRKIVDSFVNKLQEQGSRLLELKVYEDKTPVFWTWYMVEVTATASPIAWTLIIVGVLAIIFIITIIFLIKTIDEVFFKRKALDEETKKTFSRDTLIAMILDLEPATPKETLDAKEDQELRDLVNTLLAEKAPPVSWLPIAIAGIGVLGIGALAAVGFAMRPREETHRPSLSSR